MSVQLFTVSTHCSMMATTNVFEDVLTYAEDLGLYEATALQQGGPATATPKTKASTNHGNNAAIVLNLRWLEQQCSTLQAQQQALLDAQQAAGLTGHKQLQQRSQALRQAAAVLQLMVSRSSTLALRFKDVTSKQTIPVEPELQHLFSQVLKTAASGASHMAQSKQLLEWACSYSDPPRAWEVHLAPLSALANACAAVISQLEELKTHTDSMSTWQPVPAALASRAQ